MKGLISTLAALALICSSVTGLVPAINSGNKVAAAETVSDSGYTFENAKKTVKEDDLEFEVYDGYASLKYVPDKDIEEFTVPETVSGLPVVGFEYGALRDCAKLKKLTLSKNIAVVNWFELSEAAMNEIVVAEDNENFTVADGLLYTKDMKTLVACPVGKGVTEVKIPDKTEKIASGAFICCKTLKKIEMTDNVNTIEQFAFFGCEALESINLSNSLTHIYPYTFAGCFALKELTIPESVDTIENPAFTDAGCVVNDGGIHYVDNWAVASDPDIVRADIREGTVGTASGLCVSRNHLRVITVPASVKHVGMYLAVGFEMPVELVQFYNDYIPARCIVCLYVKEVHVFDPDCKIEDNAMSIPSYWKDYTDTDVKVFEEKPIDYVLDHSITRVASENVAANSIQKAVNTELVDIDELKPDNTEITSIVRIVGDNTVSGSSSDRSIEEKIQNYVEKAKKENWVVNDNSQTETAESAPTRYSAPIKIGNPARYDTIIRGQAGSTAEAYALKYRRIFEEFESVNTVRGPEVYDDDETGITYWIYDDISATARLKGDSKNKEPKDVVIPETIKGVPVTGFYIQCNLTAGKVTLPASVKSIRSSMDLQYDNTQYYEVSKDNQYFTSVDGIIYTKDMTEVVKAPSNYAKSEIVIPEGVKTIRSGAFHSLKNVESVTLPDSLEIIGNNAFCGASKLKNINFPENLDSICDNAFNGCTSLENVTLPESLKHIGYLAFYEVPAVKYEDGNGYIGDWLVDMNSSIMGIYKSGNELHVKDGTVGIARVDVNGSLYIPKSVTKMSWEMVNSSYSTFVRADVYSHVIDFDAFKNADYLKDIYIYDPECEICTGDQTIRAQHYKLKGNLMGLQLPPKRYTLTRTLAEELAETDKEELEDTVIHGYSGSTAEAYAKMYGIKFVEIGTEKYEKGDINGSGSFNVGDMVLFNRYIHGTYKLTKAQFEAADLNGDKSVDIFDAVEFRKELLK